MQRNQAPPTHFHADSGVAFVKGINSGDKQPDLAGTHKLGRDYPAMKFRLEMTKLLLPTGTAKGSKIQVRSDYKESLQGYTSPYNTADKWWLPLWE